LLDLSQGSAEWLAARIGSLGASVVHEVVARTKSGYSTSRANRMATIVLERITGQAQETFQSAAMLHGTETEPEARAAYSFYTGNAVQTVGMFLHPEIKGTHASPDGLVGEDGLVEIKCPQPAQHLATLLGQEIPEKYLLQMQWQLGCSNRKHCDFVSYSPSFPESMRLFVRRMERNDAQLMELETEVLQFLREVDHKVKSLRTKYEMPEAA
jgi:putative phage-type endonuclease